MNQQENGDSDDLRSEYSEADIANGVRGKYAGRTGRDAHVAIACRQLGDGKWRAYLLGIPSVQAYAESRAGALAVVKDMAAPAINATREPGDELRTKLNFILVDVDEEGAPTGLLSESC